MKNKEKKGKGKKIVGGIILVLGVLFIVYTFFIAPSIAFQKQEKEMAEAGEKYFFQNSYLYPKEGNVREVTLQKLYDQNYLDALYVPNSKHLCDAKESFVKVKNEKGKYVYSTYLKCGKYQSNTDGEAPVITLNGDDTVTISLGSEYKDAGVKSVKDNQDGRMNKDEVEVDTSKVNINQVGEYKVTYTAYDSWKNKRVVSRIVRVVQKLSDLIKTDTEDKGYYQGEIDAPYILFNAILWRVVGLDDAGNITLVTDRPLANIDYGTATKGDVKTTTLVKWLNDYFYNLLSDKAKDMIVKDSKWCSDAIASDNMATTECGKTTSLTVGTLSVQDFNKSIKDEFSYLGLNYGSFWLLNPSTTTDQAYNQMNYFYRFAMEDATVLNGVRPAVRVKKDVELVSGDGTQTNPYRLGDYESAKPRALLNTRLTGEYVTYSGYLFRIADISKNKTTHVIMDNVLKSDTNPISISYEDQDAKKIYNPTKKGNLGYIVSNKMTEYIKTSYFSKEEITVPIYKKYAQYGKETSTKKYKVKIAVPNTFDIFTTNSTRDEYWYINSSNQAGYKHICGRTGVPYYGNTSELKEAGVKISAYFDKDVMISGGSGTLLDPYTVKK